NGAGREVPKCASSSATAVVFPWAATISSLRPTNTNVPSSCNFTISPVGCTLPLRPGYFPAPAKSQAGESTTPSPLKQSPSSQSSPGVPTGARTSGLLTLQTHGTTTLG